jgi:ATP-GRASP peptide maturase of grasp-with-spasm system
MICIFSTSLDYSTTEVIRWLNHLGETNVIRINSDNNAGTKIFFTNSKCFFKYRNQEIALEKIKTVWYRKGKNWLCDNFFTITSENYSKFTTYYKRRLSSEQTKLSEYVHYIIENSVPSLGSSLTGDLNKLVVLQMAQKIGLKIPKFCISNYREGLQAFFKESPDLITKAMSDGVYYFDKLETQYGYFSYTEKVDKELIHNVSDVISPSFLQEGIEKKFDLRVFVLDNQSYAMAIVSQSDKQTQVDFRKYNENKPNRCVPYLLPDEISDLIKILFKELNLRTGSVDFIVDKFDNYFFLEINPVGQFDMLSRSCNYFLEKKIALNLIESSK